jgi:hypothetical protein
VRVDAREAEIAEGERHECIQRHLGGELAEPDGLEQVKQLAALGERSSVDAIRHRAQITRP